MSVQVQEALDYSPKEISAGSYVLRVVNPEVQPSTLYATSEVSTDFLLPNKVLNFKRSVLEFDYTMAGVASRLNIIHNGCLAEISSITLSTASGTRLVDSYFLPYQTKLCWRAETPLEDFLTMPVHSSDAKITTITDVKEPGHKFHRARLLNSVADDASILQGSTYYSALNGGAVVVGVDSYTGVSNHLGWSTVNQDFGVRVRLPLGMIYGTLFELDKDLYFGEQLRLTVRWSQTNDWGFRAATGAITSIEALAAPTIANVKLRVAVETNDALANALVERVSRGEGMNIKIPFTYGHRATTGGAASASSIMRRLNRGHGERCLRVYAGVFNPTQSLSTMYHNYNVGKLLWSAWRPILDSRPLTDSQLTIDDHSAWEYQQDMFKGSVIKGAWDWLQSGALYVDFSGVPRSKDFPKNDDKSSGLDLSVEREVNFEITAVPATAIVYMFSVCQKNLSLGPNGVALL